MRFMYRQAAPSYLRLAFVCLAGSMNMMASLSMGTSRKTRQGTGRAGRIQTQAVLLFLKCQASVDVSERTASSLCAVTYL